MTLEEAIKSAAETLAAAGISEARREASSLMAHTLGLPSSFLIAHPEHELSDKESQTFVELVDRRANRVPYQHITCRQEFFGLEFEVTPDVLIPRPETEILVEKAIERLSGLKDPTFIEIGVGSGCISVAILHKLPEAIAVGLDLSPAALQVASRNAEKHGVANRLELRAANLFDGIDRRFDMIVSNPPYIPEGDIAGLQAEVRDHEPLLALVGGSDGLDIIREIIAQAPDRLNPNGTLLIEIGSGQSDAVRELLTDEIWREIEFLPDLQEIPRILVARGA